MNNEKFELNPTVLTKLKYNTAKLTYNYRFWFAFNSSK
jgi:hypothetical protein